MSIHSFSCKLITGETVSLSKYAGKAALVVNTASLCGFTHSNMAWLNELQDMYDRPHVRDEKYRGKFIVLAFPCNQFGGQEPKSGCEIKAWAHSSYGITFPLFDKVNVKGASADPLWKFIGDELGTPKWNFNRYLCDPDGKPVTHFNPAVPPAAMKPHIDKLLDASL